MLKTFLVWWAYRSRIEVITGHGGDTPYLIRYHLINNRWFKLYLHYFLRNDEANPHDHPWASLSLGVQGNYTEEIYDWRTRTFATFARTAGRFVWRPASLVHRISVPANLSLARDEYWKANAPMTLFFTLAKKQDWGFVKDYGSAPVWEHWKSYLGIK